MVANLVVIVVAVIAVALTIVLVTTIVGGRGMARTAFVRLGGALREAHGAAPPPAPDARTVAETDGLLESYRWALAVREDAFGPDHPDVATACHILGAMYSEREKFAEAEPLLQRALDIRTRALGPAHSEVALTIEDLASLYRAQGRHVEAEALLEGLLAIQATAQAAAPASGTESRSPIARSGVATADGDRATTSTGPRERSDAKPDGPKIAAPKSGSGVPGSPPAEEVARGLGELAGSRGADAEPASAQELYRRELAMMEATGATDRPELRTVLRELGRLYYRQGAYAEAEPLLERALALAQRALGVDAPEVAEIRDDLAWLRFSRRSLPGA